MCWCVRMWLWVCCMWINCNSAFTICEWIWILWALDPELWMVLCLKKLRSNLLQINSQKKVSWAKSLFENRRTFRQSKRNPDKLFIQLLRTICKKKFEILVAQWWAYHKPTKELKVKICCIIYNSCSHVTDHQKYL